MNEQEVLRRIKSPTNEEILDELEKIPEDTITDRFGAELRAKSTPEASEA